MGGDTDYFYIGQYRIENNNLIVDMTATNHSGRPSSIFGPLLNFSLHLEGKLDSEIITLTATLPLHGYLQVVLQKKLALGVSPAEGFFCDGQQYDAQAVLATIISSAKATIKIADNFIGKPLFDQLTAKPAGTEIRILTKQLEASIRGLALAFKMQYGGLEIRVSPSFHDRFIIIDDKEYYHFGASLKHVGYKTFMFSKIEDPDVIASIAAKYQKEWDTRAVEV